VYIVLVSLETQARNLRVDGEFQRVQGHRSTAPEGSELQGQGLGSAQRQESRRPIAGDASWARIAATTTAHRLNGSARLGDSSAVVVGDTLALTGESGRLSLGEAG
jgi:hypothetical protein